MSIDIYLVRRDISMVEDFLEKVFYYRFELLWLFMFLLLIFYTILGR